MDTKNTKARTLDYLKPRLTHSLIEPLLFFTVEEWKKKEEVYLSVIKTKFPGRIAVRSSTVLEDSETESRAGEFLSVIGIKSTEVKEAINKVISSYDDNPKNEILIQNYTDVQMSGVVFTRKRNGAPYYVINYDDMTSDTDTVTSGLENKSVEIIRNINVTELTHPWYNIIESIREVEELYEHPLDIEFGIDWNGNVVIFQVRPLTRVEPYTEEIDNKIYEVVNSLDLKGKLYSDMAFWNPAEMLGDRPNPLDYSLYRYLITKSVWNSALVDMLYTPVDGDLMASFAGKPYVDLEKTFNALLPQSFKDRTKLIDYMKQRIFQFPELHDKVEFEIVPNCSHYHFDESIRHLEPFVNIDELKNSIEELTDYNRRKFDEWITLSKADIINMGQRRRKLEKKEIVEAIRALLDDCRDLGVVNFTRVARLAFMSKVLLASMDISESLKDEFLNSIRTVATWFDGSERYGHLRPGTYDITSPRYDQIKDIQKTERTFKKPKPKLPEILRINRDFITQSLIYREEIKFEFTKNLSDALEFIAKLGEKYGFSRKDTAFLDIETILLSGGKDISYIEELWDSLIKGRKLKKEIYDKVSLPPLLFTNEDFKIVKNYASKPNFITEKSVQGKLVYLKKEIQDIKGKIVLIENADPGYDWIFSKDIKGLITCYGGVASHMSIRCSEFGIPAIIGCGRLLFEKLKKKEEISYDCKKGSIK